MGHATRSSMLIDLLLAENCELTIYSDGISCNLLKKRYPEVEIINGAELSINYSKLNVFSHLKLLFQLQNWKKKDAERFRSAVGFQEFDVLINDARYSILPDFVSVKKSILVNHQLRPIWPFGKILAQAALDAWMQAYDEIWVPDDEKLNLTGRLSKHTNFIDKVDFIGFLSQFHDLDLPEIQRGQSINLLSGPNKERQKIKTNTNSVGEFGNEEYDKVKLLNKLSVEKIYCHSGYSSLMDAFYLGRKPIIIATKGQSEQEYLYQRSIKLGLAYSKELEGNEFIAKPYFNQIISQKIKELC